MDLKITKPIIFFDLETTGLSVSESRIIEISVTKFFPGGEAPIQKTRLLNPGVSIPEEASKVHGITDDKVKDADTFEEVAKSMFEFFKDSDLAGYNIKNFDVPLLREEFLRCGIDFPQEGTKFVDVYKIICRAIPRNLGAMFTLFTGGTPQAAHGAEYDNMMSIEVLSSILKGGEVCVDTHIGTGLNENEATVEYLDELSSDELSNGVDYANRIVLDRGGEYVFNFGKNKGKRVLDCFGYSKWMLANDFTEDTKQVLLNIWKNSNEPQKTKDEILNNY